MKKLALQREGYDPSVVNDPLFFLDGAKGSYRTLDEDLHADIREARVRI